jgi:Uma2 family endonuclease
MPVTERTYRAVALEDPEGQWELHRGRLREKPSMSFGHNDNMMELGRQLLTQLDRGVYRVRINSGRLRRQDETYYIPDVIVFPVEYSDHFRELPNSLEVYDRPVPLVVEVWSPSTGEYDIDSKLPEYQARGDLEIWRLHPFDRTLTVWRRQDDGSYETFAQTGGTIEPVALPGVTIDLDALFA